MSQGRIVAALGLIEVVQRLGRLPKVFSLLFMLVGLASPAADAQDPQQTADPYPLRLADTSSPRDTLRSFLTDATENTLAARAGVTDADAQAAFMRAVSTMDLSTTPHSGSWVVQIQRFLLLKEILDRVALPPEEEIPGDNEVAENGLARWTIPNTGIVIKRIGEGPRTGEFLFAAETVERLDVLYRGVKHLPYKPGATPDLYDAYLRSTDSEVFREREARNRLKPVDTTNPRSTLLGFLDAVSRAHVLITEAEAALAATPPTLSEEEARQIERRAHNFLSRAAFALDLKEVPASLHDEIGIETVIQLKEIFDRMWLPNLDFVPDADMVEAARQKAPATALEAGSPFRWRYPNTEIEIVEILEGDRAGEFLFSAKTVREAEEFFNKVRDLPYRSEVSADHRGQYAFSDPTKGFYDYFTTTPGYLIPRAHFLGALLDDLPDWSLAVYAEQTVWQWGGFVLSVLAAAVAVLLVFRLARRYAKHLGEVKDHWLRVLLPVIVAVIVLIVNDFASQGLNLTGDVQAAVKAGGEAIIVAMMAWAVFALFAAFAETVIAAPQIRGESIDASLLRLLAGIVGFLVAAWIVIDGLQELGADVIPLLAGLGIGGLAVALAAQKTIANVIGSLILFANRPVRVGDFCRYGDQVGTVEKIGLISTQIRSLERTIVTVPNAEFSEMKLDNISKRDERLFKTTLQLRYETTPEQLRYLLARLRQLLLTHPMVTPEPARVRFVDLAAYSQDVEIFAYLRCQDQSTFLAIKEDILLRIVGIVNEAGTGFAFPSQTAYLGRDDGLDEDRARTAEEEVAAWRAKGALPFPEFEEQERERLQDTLDYPPKGSPHIERDEGDAALPGESPATGDSADRKQARDQ